MKCPERETDKEIKGKFAGVISSTVSLLCLIKDVFGRAKDVLIVKSKKDKGIKMSVLYP